MAQGSSCINEDFTGFMLCKAFDVLSNGGFKRHLIQSRDRGDAWAIQMHAQQNRITQECKGIHAKIAHLLDKTHNAGWAQICKDVMSSAQPPIKVFTGYSQCAITGENLSYSVDLSRNCKNSHDVHVHLRFWHFFILLWFTTKIEYVIRSCTKQWVEANADCKQAKEGMTALCERFKETNQETVCQMAQLFKMAIDYVNNSIDLYQEQFDVHPIIRPPASFFEE